MPARPQIEEWLKTASDTDRESVDEFIGVLTGDGDSGSVYDVLRAVIKLVGVEYVIEAVRSIEREP